MRSRSEDCPAIGGFVDWNPFLAAGDNHKVSRAIWSRSFGSVFLFAWSCGAW